MSQVAILAGGTTPSAQAQARGKLFENLMAEVLRYLGFKIDRIPSVNYSGMEIDIEGRAIVTEVPIYAECKFYENEIDSPKLQAFFGKYTAMWLRDHRCQGLFISVPGVNSHAKGFYRDNMERAEGMTVRLLEQDTVFDAAIRSNLVCRLEEVERAIPAQLGRPGDSVLAYTDRGYFWIMYVVPPGSAIANAVAVFDHSAQWIQDDATLEHLRTLKADLAGFERLLPLGTRMVAPSASVADVEEIVEVRGSSACFEYQFPASPQFFVGREGVFRQIDSFITAVVDRSTSARGLLFEGNSGLGKSSAVLATVDRLKAAGHFALSIDCRSASSSQFILRVVDHLQSTFGDFGGLLSSNKDATVAGVETAAKRLVTIGRQLSSHGKLLVVFFDQFENLFYLADVLRPIRDVFLKVSDAQTNVILGFSWKTDLFGLTTEFPYQIRDAIASASKRIPLELFSEAETSNLLSRLGEELRSRLRKDLVFFLSEFSQGYPWLLKKLCAHVKTQREAGVPQANIAESLLNVEQLFQEDLRGLSPEQDYALRRIAKAAPISSSEMGEDLKPDVLQSLINARLIIRVGSKVDIYWDIFKDYLNSGRVPIQDNYILRMQVGSVLKAAKRLSTLGAEADASVFQEESGVSEKSFYNTLKELRLLGIAEAEGRTVRSLLTLPSASEEFEAVLRAHVKDRLKRNRVVWHIIEKLETDPKLAIDDVAKLLETACPYVSATKKTWQTYARVFADWMDFSDLAVFDSRGLRLLAYRPGREVRQRGIVLGLRRRDAIALPGIHYSPVIEVARRIVTALTTRARVDFSELKPSTILKSLATLEDLGFIVRETGTLTPTPKMLDFARDPGSANRIFREAVLQLEGFSTFLQILGQYAERGATHLVLGRTLSTRLGYSWKDGTAAVIAKVLLDWARHTGIAPSPFAPGRRGRRALPEGPSLFGK
ncbi:MAG: restriction endonuclease [Terriglobia bacterium]